MIQIKNFDFGFQMFLLWENMRTILLRKVIYQLMKLFNVKDFTISKKIVMF